MAQAVTEFQSLLSTLASELESRIAQLLNTTVSLDKSELLAFITDTAPALLSPFLSAAADLTAVWYEDQDPTSDFQAIAADIATDDDLAASARWALLQANPLTAWSGAASKSLFDTSRETVATNAAREGIRWALHAREDACGFCRLRALNGFKYTSEVSALGVRNKGTENEQAKSHDHCNCTAVPERGSRKDPKYPPAYLDQWRQEYEAARKVAGSKAKKIANAMDYLPGGRRYKGDNGEPYTPREPVNLDQPAPKPTKAPAEPKPTETDAQAAKRLLPGFEKSLADLRAKGLPEDSPQIQYHLTQIARLRRQLSGANG